MLGNISFDFDPKRVAAIGVGAVVLILIGAAILLALNLPDANAFNLRVERIFVENDDLTSGPELRLLEILAQSGTAFSDTLNSYRVVLFILFVFATALLITSLVFLVVIVSLTRKITQAERSGIAVRSLLISREAGVVVLNEKEYQLTPSALETLSILAEARMDDEVLSGTAIEAIISGKGEADCEESAGATRIKRLRDALGNQMVAELLVKNIVRKGYYLSIDKSVIQML
jgi:DNA-binding winged helix-turn-helix (wHTH) protein